MKTQLLTVLFLSNFHLFAEESGDSQQNEKRKALTDQTSCKLFDSCGSFDMSERRDTIWIDYDHCARAGYGSHEVGSFKFFFREDGALFIESDRLNGNYIANIPEGFAYKAKDSSFTCSDLEIVLGREIRRPATGKD